jgi:putative polyhydroxyalkanoate system protein
MILVRRHHRLGLARARHLAETMARRLQADYGGSYEPTRDGFQFRRAGASGSVAITDTAFEIRIELGFLLSALESRIEREVRAFCDQHLGGEGSPDPARPVRPRASRDREGGAGRKT